MYSMAKSKRNPDRKKQLVNYKQKVKSMNTQQAPQAPEVRQTPVWRQNDIIEITGAEWEAIYNFIDSATPAFMAANQVMSRAIVKGTVQLRFDKLNNKTNKYEPMTADEEKPYQDELQANIQKVLNMQADAEAKAKADSQEGVPYIDSLVDSQGNPVSSEEVPKDGALIVS